MNEHLAMLLVFALVGYCFSRYRWLTRRNLNYPRPQRAPKGLGK